MNKENLEELNQELGVTPADRKALWWGKLKENWFYPVTTLILTAIAAFLGWLDGRNDEKLVNRDTGREYPFNMVFDIPFKGGLAFLLIGLPSMGISGVIAALKARKEQGEKREQTLRVGLATALILAILVVVVYIVVYKVSQPIEYYSGAIEYGVFSQEERP